MWCCCPCAIAIPSPATSMRSTPLGEPGAARLRQPRGMRGRCSVFCQDWPSPLELVARFSRWFASLRGCPAVWLGAMDLRLKHPGYAGREVIAATIVSQALLTLAALHFRRLPHLRWVALVGCISVSWLSGNALFRTLHGAHPEGYVLLIAMALLLQVALTCLRFVKTQIEAKPNA